MALCFACPMSKTGLVTPHRAYPRGHQSCQVSRLTSALSKLLMFMVSSSSPLLCLFAGPPVCQQSLPSWELSIRSSFLCQSYPLVSLSSVSRKQGSPHGDVRRIHPPPRRTCKEGYSLGLLYYSCNLGCYVLWLRVWKVSCLFYLA